MLFSMEYHKKKSNLLDVSKLIPHHSWRSDAAHTFAYNLSQGIDPISFSIVSDYCLAQGSTIFEITFDEDGAPLTGCVSPHFGWRANDFFDSRRRIIDARLLSHSSFSFPRVSFLFVDFIHLIDCKSLWLYTCSAPSDTIRSTEVGWDDDVTLVYVVQKMIG